MTKRSPSGSGSGCGCLVAMILLVVVSIAAAPLLPWIGLAVMDKFSQDSPSHTMTVSAARQRAQDAIHAIAVAIPGRPSLNPGDDDAADSELCFDGVMGDHDTGRYHVTLNYVLPGYPATGNTEALAAVAAYAAGHGFHRTTGASDSYTDKDGFVLSAYPSWDVSKGFTFFADTPCVWPKGVPSVGYDFPRASIDVQQQVASYAADIAAVLPNHPSLSSGTVETAGCYTQKRDSITRRADADGGYTLNGIDDAQRPAAMAAFQDYATAQGYTQVVKGPTYATYEDPSDGFRIGLHDSGLLYLTVGAPCSQLSDTSTSSP